MKRQGKKAFGFTIVELMIVVMLVAILLAIAYPSYIQYVRKAKRGEAQQLLMNWAINQEIWRSNNPAYAGNGDIPPPTHDDYTFSVTASATAYTLTAAAKSGNDQLNDKARDGTACSTLNMNSAGVKYSGGDPSILVCWD